MLPDDVIEPTVAMSEMIRVRQEHGGSVLLAVGGGAVAGGELWRL